MKENYIGIYSAYHTRNRMVRSVDIMEKSFSNFVSIHIIHPGQIVIHESYSVIMRMTCILKIGLRKHTIYHIAEDWS